MDALRKLLQVQDYMHTEVIDDSAWVEDGATNPKISKLSNGSGASAAEGCWQDNLTQSPNKVKLSSLPIHYAALPNGGRIPLLKTALTTACERNCTYCAFRTGRDFQRQTFQPDELAKIFMQLYHAGVVKGLFLSSGVAGGGVSTQDRLLAAAEILRQRYDFQGYLHLKIMPGAERSQVERAMQLSDRVSVNLEAPTTSRLKKLAPEKRFLEELLTPLRWVETIRENQPAYWGWKKHWPSSTTQFVVGAIDESDVELLQITTYLHHELKLGRVYFSGFKPVVNTPLENQPAVHPQREVRLYQASFLIRDYEFDFEDLGFTREGNLPLEIDPKLAWAQTNLAHSPLEVNEADYHQLLKVPGIGPMGAKKLLAQRSKGVLHSPCELKRLGILLPRSAPFILVNGKRPPQQIQLPLG